MIVCLYGRSCAAFVERVTRDLQLSAAAVDAELVPLTVEAAMAERRRWQEVEGVYVLPFDVPLGLPPDLPSTSAALVHALFPAAHVFNDLTTHELCWDRPTAARRLLARGVPMPDSLITEDPDEARAFVAEHEHAVLKAPRTCGGQGHMVMYAGAEQTLVGECLGRRYVIELEVSGDRRRLAHGVLSIPGPFYLQKLIADVGKHGRLSPAQVLRAYIVDGQIVCWTERYRDHHRRPSDFIVTIALGARYRFLHAASDEARKIAVRTAEVLGVRFGVVDLIRTGSEGPYPLAAHTDGPHMYIDRQFKNVPEFRPSHDFDRFLAEALVRPAPEPEVRRLRPIDASSDRRRHEGRTGRPPPKSR
jgi:glutathione synthase/RimK-type ligase-like ATP-grasp enzyme